MNKKLLIIGCVWPEPNSSAAGSRMMQLINAFLSKGYNITFASSCSKNNNAFNLKSINISEVNITLNCSSFDRFLKGLNPEIVLFDRFIVEEQFGWRVAEHCPNALRVLDTEDLHGLRKGRQQAFKEGNLFNKTYLFNDTSKREIASIYRCDLTLIISEAEMKFLENDFKVDKSLLIYLPFMLETVSKNSIEALPNFKARQHFLTIGNFLHPPNYDAVLYLKKTIWPLIKKQLPKAKLHIYGAYVSQKANQLHNEKEGFLIKGFTPDSNKAMQQARICLAPIRFGAGLKGKLVDAMKNGTPCVTTKIGSESMFEEHQANGFIEDNPDEFAKKAVLLHNTQDLWKTKQLNGFTVINQRFNKDFFQDLFLKRIETATKQLHENRLNNFTGQILQHQSLQSSKFMSKWIEEKNSKKI